MFRSKIYSNPETIPACLVRLSQPKWRTDASWTPISQTQHRGGISTGTKRRSNLCLFSRAQYYQHFRSCTPESLPSSRHCHEKTGHIHTGTSQEVAHVTVMSLIERARIVTAHGASFRSVSTPKRTSSMSWHFVLQRIRQRIAAYMEASHCNLVTSLEGRSRSLMGVKNTVQDILPLTRRQWTRDET